MSKDFWAVVVAQLVEWLLPIQEIRGSNPVISKNYIVHLFGVNCFEKKKIKKKMPGMAHLKKDFSKKAEGILSLIGIQIPT